MERAIIFQILKYTTRGTLSHKYDAKYLSVPSPERWRTVDCIKFFFKKCSNTSHEDVTVKITLNREKQNWILLMSGPSNSVTAGSGSSRKALTHSSNLQMYTHTHTHSVEFKNVFLFCLKLKENYLHWHQFQFHSAGSFDKLSLDDVSKHRFLALC